MESSMISTFLSIGLGIGLAASSGFRIFVPLFASSIAVHYSILPVNESFAWVASTPALIILGIASIVEAVAYLIPFIDNLLDTIAIPMAGIAGTLVMAASMTDISPEITWALAIIAGGGAAVSIKSSAAASRAVSSATTAGVGNPLISVGETGTAIGLSILSIFMPLLALGVSVVLIIMVIWFAIRVKKKLAR